MPPLGVLGPPESLSGLTTSRCPMWSRPDDLAELVSGLARFVS
ncbi:hypothetical protein [uncultured Nocardioides sp.]|uniref:Uncharacterized protein n=1 Tax=uncultured Nocardioides sp. TaxID=198441 RepID=A0A6J4NGK6_9ACTN|nr:hypothetical protein [uncultured Nocardioides sp.]CAA9384657.1 MAG: hypothetical protein AVDCRST_MAG06-1187 [uncultured Nocardioides sp.]